MNNHFACHHEQSLTQNDYQAYLLNKVTQERSTHVLNRQGLLTAQKLHTFESDHDDLDALSEVPALSFKASPFNNQNKDRPKLSINAYLESE